MSDFERILRRKTERFADLAALNIGGTAVSKYMRKTGAKTPDQINALGRNKKTGKGSLRILTRRLASSLTGARSSGANMNVEGVFNVKQSGTKTTLTYGTKVPYARAQEEGFSGTVQIPSHTRRITQAFGRQIEPKTVQVSAHSKNMNLPARPYLGPALDDQLPKLKEDAQNILIETVEEFVRDL